MRNLLIAVIVALLAAGAWIMLSGSDDADDMSDETAITTDQTVPGLEADGGGDMLVEGGEEESDVVVVTYTGDGFDPETVEVSVGTTVRFFNESSKNVQVASNDHPSHLILPEFDSNDGFGTNEFYEFTFDEAGSWGYHNHLSDSERGTVNVVE